MPKVNLPTPGSSSDIRGADNTNTPIFNLPPTAYPESQDRASTGSATPSTNGSDSSYRPVSPNSPAATTRKKPAVQPGPVITKEDFSLPPPPTRSRKIIQMKPREVDQQQSQQATAQAATSSSQATGKANTAAGQTGGKRKQANAGTTAAGRKIARKTAHSLIERRRRSKMNEEFGVLKDMIPACRGQEMHKLAILQASIEYLRYLEQCVSDLQAQNNSASSIPPPPPSSTGRSERIEEDDDDEDEEMEDDHEPVQQPMTSSRSNLRSSGSLVSLPPLSQITSAATTMTSPSVFSAGGGRHYSISSAASQPSYSPLYPSNQTSPAFGPQLHHLSSAGPGFGLGSPALKPQDSSAWYRQIAESTMERVEKHARLTSSSSSSSSANAGVMSAHSHVAPYGRTEHELDQEATAALLMLNHDRRNWRASEPEATRSTTGMSVKDLLSG